MVETVRTAFPQVLGGDSVFTVAAECTCLPHLLARPRERVLGLGWWPLVSLLQVTSEWASLIFLFLGL